MAINWEKVEEQAKARDAQQYNAMKADTERLNTARSTTSNTSGTLQKAPRQQPISRNLRRDSLLDALLNDPTHINEVVDSTTGQVIQAEKPSALGRTVTGALKGSAAGFANTGGTLLDLLRSYDTAGSSFTRRSNQEAENANHYREMLERGTLDDGTVIDAEMRTWLENLAGRADTRSTQYAEAAQTQHAPITRATARIYETADQLAESSAKDIQEAKQGLGTVGQAAVDIGSAGVQLGGDILLGALTGTALAPMAVRSFGSGAQEARQEGATLGQQVAYGAGSAALGVATEKISNVAAPLRRAFGSGVLDTAISRTTGRLGQSVAGQTVLSALSEGGEEVVEALVQPVIQRITYDENALQQYQDPDFLADALYQGLIGGALGGIAGGVGGVVNNRRTQTTNGGTQQATESAQTETAPVSTTQAQRAAEGGTGQRSAPASAAANTGDSAGTTPGTVGTVTDGRASQGVPVDRTVSQRTEAVNPDPLLQALTGGRRVDQTTLTNEQFASLADRGDIGMDAHGRVYQVDPAQHIDQRGADSISDRRVNAFQFDHPDLQPYYREAAQTLMQELNGAVRGGQIETSTGQYGQTYSWRPRRQASDRINSLLDNGMSYARIESALDAIINDNGAENYADAKRVEAVLDDMLSNGYRGDDRFVPANENYIQAKDAIPGAVERVDQLAGVDEDLPSDQLARILFGNVQQTPPSYDNLGSARQGFTSTQNDGGTIPVNQHAQVTTQSVQGREPTEVPRINPRTGQEISRTVSTILNSPVTSNEFAAEINAAIPDGTFDNIRISDRAAVTNSQAKIDQEGYRAVADRFLTKSDLNQRLSKWDMADAIMAYNAANEIGDKVTAYNLAVAISGNAHDSAQIVQAVNLMNRLTPEGKLITLRRFVNKLNLDRAPNARTSRGRTSQDEARYQYVEQNTGYTISDELATTYLMAETEAERSAAWDAIMTDIANQIPGTFIDKANFVRYTSMLLNPTTHTRNLAGNAIQWGARKIKNAIGTVLERAVIRDPSARTKSFLNPVSKGDRALKRFARDQYTEDQAAAMGTGKYVDGSSSGIAQEIRARQRAFRGSNILSRGIQALGDLNSKVLDAEDLLFNRPAYVGALARALKARGVTAQEAASGQKADLVAQARAYAIQEAQKATYRNTTEFSEAVSRAGSYRGENRLLRAASFAVNAEFPFRRTPANILTTALDYSPAGLAVGIKDALWDVHRGNMTAADAIDHISAGLTGTGILALGAFLASQGLLTLSPGEDDREQEYLENMGYQGYALQIGDHSYTLDWALPAAMPLFAGAAIMESIQNDGGTFEEVMDALAQVSGVLLEMSMMSSLDDFMAYYAYAENKPLYVLDSIASDYLGQFVPTLGGRISSAIDDTARSSYSESGSGQLESDVDYFLQSILRKIPGAREQMQPSIDLWGNEVSNGSLPERLLENFVSPGYYSGTDSSALDQELMRLAQSTGSSTVYPSKVSKTINVNGKEKPLTGDEYTEFARTVGSTRFDIASALIESDAYQQAPDDLKAEMLGDAYDYANAIGKQAVSDYELDGWIKKAEESRVSPADYIIFMATSDRHGSGRTDQVEAGQTLLEIMGISDKQRSSVWRAQDSSWNMDKDPFGGKLLGYGIPPETSLQIMAKYKEIDDTVYAGKSVPRQKQTDFERYLDTLGLNESQLAAVNDLYKFWSMYPAESYN